MEKFICGDCIEVMNKMPIESVDFVFADPPYFMQVDTTKSLGRPEGGAFQGCNDDWDKFANMESYKNFTRQWLTGARRVLKKDGSICVISGMQSIHEIGSILRELGFWVLNDIVWQKSNPTPNFGGTRLCNVHETLIWAAKSKNSKVTFNYKTGKAMNNGKQMGSVWTFPVCSGNERLKDKEGNKLHTTQKPEALLHRVICLFTKPNDLILDPFAGTCTTGAVAKRCGRNSISIEMEQRYLDYGIERVKTAEPCIGDTENAVCDIKPMKVSFKELADAGYVRIGEIMRHIKTGGTVRLVSDNGYVEYGDFSISMHEAAAKMMGRTGRVNGYEWFAVERGGEWVSLMDIRERYRQNHA